MSKFGKERLFEMMNRVSGMPLLNENINSGLSDLPFGISPDNFTPLEDYIKDVPCSTDIQEEIPLGAQGKEIDDIQSILKGKDLAMDKGVKQNVAAGGRLHKNMMKDIRIDSTADSGMDEYDIEKLKQILTKKPDNTQIILQNEKMKKSDFYNITIPAFTGLFYHIKEDKFYVITTCPHAGTCQKICFAQMGNYIKNDPVVRLNAQKLNYLLNYPNEWKQRIIGTILGLKPNAAGEIVVRWHDSGDFLSEEYMRMVLEIAEATPESEQYAYTKEVGLAKSMKLPPNFEFKYSYGGTEDASIDRENDPHAEVVPKELFSELHPKVLKMNSKTKKEYWGKGWNFSAESEDIIKDRISKKYGINKNIIITNAELKKIPYNKEKVGKREWIVINKSGDDDIPALRKDVLGVYNLEHK